MTKVPARPVALRILPAGAAPASLLLCLIGLASPLPSSAQKKTIDPADICNLKRVEDPAISPNGRLVAYAVKVPVAYGQHDDTHIWLAQTDRPGTARPFAYSAAAADESPAWSPDGTHLAFLSDRPNPLAQSETSPFRFTVAPGTDVKAFHPGAKDKNEDESGAEKQGKQLWYIALDGGEAEPLTNLPGSILSFKWSPDGRFIAFIRADTDSPADRARKAAGNDEHFIDGDYHYQRLWIYDLAERQARLLSQQDLNIDSIDWSPDGATILARVSPTPRIDDYWRVSKVVLIDAKTGAVTRTIETDSGYTSPTFSHDGKRIAFSRFTPRAITDVHLVMNLADGKVIELENKLPGTVYQMLWDGTGGHLLVSEYVGAHTEEIEVDTADFTVKPVPGISVAGEDFDASHDGRTVAYLGNSPKSPADVYIWKDGSSQAVTDINPQVAQWSIGTQREISWKNPNDHRIIYGVVALPPGYQQGVRYKTIVLVHGGPEEAWTLAFDGNWYNYATMLASHDYVVLLPDPRGSDGQGPAFTEADYQQWGGGDFEDVMAGVDYLIQQGITDPNRMAIGGWSFGGFMTAWAVTHTNRFKAAVDGAGVVDLYSMATTTDISPSFMRRYLGPLATNAAIYDRESPVRYLSHYESPALTVELQAQIGCNLFCNERFIHIEAKHILHRICSMVAVFWPGCPSVQLPNNQHQNAARRSHAFGHRCIPSQTGPSDE